MAKKSKKINNESKDNGRVSVSLTKRYTLDELAEILGFIPEKVQDLAFGNVRYANSERNINLVYNPKSQKVIVPPYTPQSSLKGDFHRPAYAIPAVITSWDFRTRQFTGSSSPKRKQGGYGSRKKPY